ncbi:MAG: rhomboid family intramembrane serine protease [Flavobacteriales bacterium]|nr:rhomboid family intramembrane serine protease [Flavobacteriales bacterium]
MRRYYSANDVRYAFMGGNTLKQLLIVNLSVFLGFFFLRVILLLVYSSNPDGFTQTYYDILSWAGMPMQAHQLLLRFYTPFTYMVVHTDFFHFLFNMLALYVFGRIFMEFLGPKRLLPLYVFSGLAGALLTFLLFQIPALHAVFSNTLLIGASASILGIMAATALLYPNLPLNMVLIGPVKLKYIALFYLLIDLVSISYAQNMGGHFAHLGGMLMGVCYALFFKNGYDLAAGWIKLNDRLFGKRAKIRVRMTVMHGGRSMSDEEYNIRKKEREATLDELLDKINEKGIKSLTRRERELLDKYSRESK